MMSSKTVPEKRGATPRVSLRPAPLKLNFKNHCLLCLEPVEPSTILEIISTNSRGIRTFQPVVHYLTGSDPTVGLKKREGGSEQDDKNKDIPAMANLPPMCVRCYDVCGEIHRLHFDLLAIQVKLQKQVELGRSFVEGAAKPRKDVSRKGMMSRRGAFREAVRGCGMPEEQADASVKFIDNLHRLILLEGNSKVIYPSYPPPNFVPVVKPIQPGGLLIPVQLIQVPTTSAQQIPNTSLPPSVPPVVSQPNASPCIKKPKTTDARPLILRRRKQRKPKGDPLAGIEDEGMKNPNQHPSVSSRIQRTRRSRRCGNLIILPGGSSKRYVQNEGSEGSGEDDTESIRFRSVVDRRCEEEIIKKEEPQEESESMDSGGIENAFETESHTDEINDNLFLASDDD